MSERVTAEQIVQAINPTVGTVQAAVHHGRMRPVWPPEAELSAVDFLGMTDGGLFVYQVTWREVLPNDTRPVHIGSCKVYARFRLQVDDKFELCAIY